MVPRPRGAVRQHVGRGLGSVYRRPRTHAPHRADALLAAHEHPPHGRPAGREPGPTAVLEHGANPGLISHWTKQGLIDIGPKAARRTRRSAAPRPRNCGSCSKTRTFNRLAMKLGVKVIHCSERDTQITDRAQAGR